MEKTHKLSQEILSIFAEALGFPTDHFAKAHQITADDAQTTLRLLHYHDIQGIEFPPQYWRAGAHTDFDCLTMLFQRTGEDGLEVCPGREAHSGFAKGDMWTPVEPITGEIVCNIGDMLMSWSDDRFKSLFHRVRCPKIGENQKERYSIAYGSPSSPSLHMRGLWLIVCERYFNQANKNVVVQGPQKKYPPLTAHEYIMSALERNFAQLKT
jgi:isopenicillin N synthase-like dioxygenase